MFVTITVKRTNNLYINILLSLIEFLLHLSKHLKEIAIMMHKFKILIIIVTSLLFLAPSSIIKDFSKARYNNVCKDLRDDVLLYFVFVDTRTTYPWTEFDILSTIDSIHVAKRWIERQAEKSDITLNIKTDYYIGNEYATINRNLPRETVKQSIADPNLKKGMASLNRWGDYVSKMVGESMYVKEKDGIPPMKKPGNKERLVAFLRDEYNVESVALMFFVNNYFRNDISLAVNTYTTADIEFAIVSYKYPAEIAHNFLHLFGAVDLYRTYERNNRKRIRFARKQFPFDIMQDPYATNIMDQHIGEFSRYMIGWTDELDNEYELLLTDGLF